MKYFKYLAYVIWFFVVLDFTGQLGSFQYGFELIFIGLFVYSIPYIISKLNIDNLNKISSSKKEKGKTYCISIDDKKIKPNSDEYDKVISDGIRKLVFDDGHVYEGEIKDGERNGKGTVNYEDGSKYVGEWKDSKMDGYGIFKYKKKDESKSYEGNFKNDNLHGYGVHIWSNGDVYKGNWENGFRTGKGTYTWKNGNHYEGEWFKGSRHGIGTENYTDKSFWRGEWIKDEKFKGKWTYPIKREKIKKPEDKRPQTIPDERHRVINEDAEWLGNGSGIFISKDGYLVTNYHVVENAYKISAEFLYNNEIENFKIKIIRNDKLNDLTILKIDDKKFKGFKSLPYSLKKSTCDVGTEVYALGYPMALDILGKDLKFTDGKISAKSGAQGDISKYQTTVPIQGGNSGGPLFDTNGNLVGIMSSKIRQDVADNVSYAIKSDYLITFINALPQRISLPSSRSLNGKKQTEQIKKLSDFVILIKIS